MSHSFNRLRVFTYPAFRWYLLSAVLASLSNGLSYIVMTWMVLRGNSQHQVAAVAILMMCFWLPSTLFGPFVGVLIDRFKHRQLLLALINFLRAIALVSFGYMLWRSHSNLVLYFLSFTQGTLFSFLLPTIGRLTREMVPHEELLSANATIDMVFEFGNIFGMGLAGILMIALQGSGVLILTGVFFLGSGLALLMIRKKDLLISEEASSSWNFISDFKQGLRYIFSEKAIFVVYSIQLLFLVEYLTAPVLLAPFAKQVLHANVSQFGHLEASLSAGIVLGGVLLPWLANKFGLNKTIAWTSIFLAAGYIIFSYNHFIPLAEAIYFVIGICFAIWPIIITKAQHITDIRYQGRVQSCFNALSGLMILLLYLSIKIGSDYFSIHFLYWIKVFFTIIILYLLTQLKD